MNYPDGSVVMVAEGLEQHVEGFLQDIMDSLCRDAARFTGINEGDGEVGSSLTHELFELVPRESALRKP